MELRSFHAVFQPKGKSGKVRIGDIVLLQEDLRPKHVEESPGGGAEGGERRGHENGRTPRGEGNVLVRPIQLVIPLEVDQGGEDVEDL